jgi:hypothetical protein
MGGIMCRHKIRINASIRRTTIKYVDIREVDMK